MIPRARRVKTERSCRAAVTAVATTLSATRSRTARAAAVYLLLVAAISILLLHFFTPAAHAQQPIQLPADGRGELGDKPNVIIVLADDFGYGDMGCQGNKNVLTRALDKFHDESIRLTNFHSEPIGAPTRAGVLTGQYSARGGVWSSGSGRSLLNPKATTAADIFRKAGYRTGIYGKWHLGENYPYRPIDRGFEESLVHGGRFIGDISDWWGNRLFDPVLFYQGKPTKVKGFCTDVFFSAAIRFIEKHRREKFFVMITPNVPRVPFAAPQNYVDYYKKRSVPDDLAEYYAMVSNLDVNFGKLLKTLDQWQLTENTIVIFMADNGKRITTFRRTGSGEKGAAHRDDSGVPIGENPDPTEVHRPSPWQRAQDKEQTGRTEIVMMRGRKGWPYEGGHRVPCFIRWPRKLVDSFDVAYLTSHIDLLPTLLSCCELRRPYELRFDGKSIVPLLVGAERWAPRTLFVQAQELEMPQKWRNTAVMNEKFDSSRARIVITEEYRLIGGRELYNVRKDPEQTFNIGGEQPDYVNKLTFAYDEWYKDVSQTFGTSNAIVLGSTAMPRTSLCCFDWHGTIPESQSALARQPLISGYWSVEVAREGRYRFTLRDRPAACRHELKPGIARLKIGMVERMSAIPQGVDGAAIEADVPAGRFNLQAWLIGSDRKTHGAYYVDVEYLGPSQSKTTNPSRPTRPAEPVQRHPTGPSAYD